MLGSSPAGSWGILSIPAWGGRSDPHGVVWGYSQKGRGPRKVTGFPRILSNLIAGLPGLRVSVPSHFASTRHVEGRGRDPENHGRKSHDGDSAPRPRPPAGAQSSPLRDFPSSPPHNASLRAKGMLSLAWDRERQPSNGPPTRLPVRFFSSFPTGVSLILNFSGGFVPAVYHVVTVSARTTSWEKQGGAEQAPVTCTAAESTVDRTGRAGSTQSRAKAPPATPLCQAPSFTRV